MRLRWPFVRRSVHEALCARMELLENARAALRWQLASAEWALDGSPDPGPEIMFGDAARVPPTGV